MRSLLILLIALTCLSSCKSSKRTSKSKVVTKKERKSSVKKKADTRESNDAPYAVNNTATIEEKIIDYAKSFEGVKYRWGGTTESGMDCSGLVFESFKNYGIYLPRISRDMAKKGIKIALKESEVGDLLFFKTGKSKRNAINHVGLVVEASNGKIKFIHSTTRKGVIVSSISETYWNTTFFEARRIL